MFFSLTDPGPRAENQDCICIEKTEHGTLAAVADGVGGNNGGQYASSYTIDSLVAGFRDKAELAVSIEHIHTDLLERASSSPDLLGMATTLTATTINGLSLRGVHVGDSRAYILRRHGLKQLSRDHTEVADLLALGRITKDQAATYPRKNILSNAIGIPKGFKFQVFNFDLQAGDRILLLTDGIYSLLPKWEIQRHSAATPHFQTFCEGLVALVRDRKPTDNFSLVGIEMEG